MRQIRSMHPYAFRSGEWADIVGETVRFHGPCYVVRFPDGAQDLWLVDDPTAGYEYRLRRNTLAEDMEELRARGREFLEALLVELRKPQTVAELAIIVVALTILVAGIGLAFS